MFLESYKIPGCQCSQHQGLWASRASVVSLQEPTVRFLFEMLQLQSNSLKRQTSSLCLVHELIHQALGLYFRSRGEPEATLKSSAHENS
jgi:hypothetical protein